MFGGSDIETNPGGTATGSGQGPHVATAPRSGIRQTLHEIRDTGTVIWWRFFDWLAVVSWKKLLLVSLLALILGGIAKHPTPVLMLVVASFIIKAVAGGKRRAELTADEATKRAETEQLERTVVEARMEALQAQIEPHFLFNTLASIDQLIQTDPKRASEMQKSLIRYLRSAMPQMREGSRPTLGQQLGLSSAFLEIMAIRMEERLRPVVNVPEGLKSAVFPPMMLQNSREHQRQQGHEQQLLPRHDGEPVEEAPPDHGARIADLVQRLPNSGTPHGGPPLACVAACC